MINQRKSENNKMKKNLLIAAFCLMGTVCPIKAEMMCANNQNMMEVTAVKEAEIKFDTLEHNFGDFPASDPVVKCVFTFTNIGDAPLVIHQAIASCGCTVPTYTRMPIKPGEKGKIEVTYNGHNKNLGRFRKSITIRTNSKEPVTRLYITGNMVEGKK